MHDYLDAHLNENASEEEVQQAKKDWRRYYLRHAKRKSREKHKELSVLFPDIATYKRLKQAAKDHNRNFSKFLIECTEKYLQKQYVQVQEDTWQEISQAVKMMEVNIKNIAQGVEDEQYNTSYSYELLLQNLLDTQQFMEKALNSPKLITQALTDLIQKQPWQKEKLLSYLQSL